MMMAKHIISTNLFIITNYLYDSSCPIQIKDEEVSNFTVVVSFPPTSPQTYVKAVIDVYLPTIDSL